MTPSWPSTIEDRKRSGVLRGPLSSPVPCFRSSLPGIAWESSAFRIQQQEGPAQTHEVPIADNMIYKTAWMRDKTRYMYIKLRLEGAVPFIVGIVRLLSFISSAVKCLDNL